MAGSTVPVISLDEYLGRAQLAPDVVKIDVEGGELGVLRGMREILRKRPVILFELWPSGIEKQGESPAAVFELLHGAGLRCYEPNCEKRRFRPVTEDDLPRLCEQNVTNLIAGAPDEIRALETKIGPKAPT